MNKKSIRAQAAAFDAVGQATKAMRDAAQKATPRYPRRSWLKRHAYVVAAGTAGILVGTAIVWGLHHATFAASKPAGSCKVATGASRSTCSTSPSPPRPNRTSRH
jgi:hypothetical protein